MITTVIFDLGAVLIDWNPRYVFKHLFVTKEAMEYFLENICNNEWNELQDAGRSFEDATKILIQKFPEYSAEIEAYYGRWEEMLAGPIHETVSLLSKIKTDNKYRLLALTNWSAESFPIALKRFEFLSWFDGIVVSGEEKLKKPDPEIFNLLLDRYLLNSSECLFIDDNINNIKSAKVLGFQCVHFEDVETSLNEILKLLKY